jgi:RNA recognition motif-containing protein
LVEALAGVCNGVRVAVMNIYVGNLSYGMSEDELRDAFSAFGDVSSVKILMDRETGRSRGFGFVEMPNKSEGDKAIAELNGKDVGGRALRINEARPKEERR